MALMKKFLQTKKHFNGSLEIPNAYWRVETFNFSKNQSSFIVSINKKENNECIKVHQKEFFFSPDINGKNFIAQAYDHLKTLPEFAGATDC